MKKYLIITSICFCAFTANSNSQVYKNIDEDGKVTFSDKPSYKGQEPEDVAPPMSYDPKQATPRVSPAYKPKIKIKKKPVEYNELTIESPQNDANIRDNAGNITVQFKTQPALNKNAQHYFVLFLDGNRQLEGQSTIMNLTNLDRGTHTLSIEIHDVLDVKLIKSPEVQFHLQRTSLNQPRRN